ncbi:MAG: phytoene desaturase [Deltaproteobacteria bacterium]|nr:phytoene desaturase [Deltaproteobacteria bacterium]
MTKPIVIIGAGYGGLAAAIRLRARGWPVHIVEAGPQPGGRGRVFQRDGHRFDAGPTVITAPYLLDELFALLGRRLEDYAELVPVDPFYRVRFSEGGHFDYVQDDERLLAQIEAFNPRDVDGYQRMVKHSRRIFEIGYQQLADVPFDSFTDMLRVAPDMLRLGNHRSVYGMVSSYIRDPRLRQVFTFQPLLIGGNPFNVSSIYLLIHWLERKWGVWFPKGGSYALIEAMVKLLGEVDVPVQLNAPVEEILVEGGRATGVRLADGTVIEASHVVSNADPTHTYKELIAPEHRRKHTDQRAGRVRQSMGLFVGYFGVEGDYNDTLRHHEILLGPRYKELLHDIFDRRVLADDFSLYLHNPSRTDPSLAPAGRSSFYVLSPVPNQRSGLDWSELGEAYFDKILGHLEDRLMPGLRGRITTRFHLTPRYFEESLRSPDGAGFGPEPTLTQSAWFRYHNRSEDVKSLFFVGAGTHPGAGVPGVITGAKVLDRIVPDPAERLDLPGMRG